MPISLKRVSDCVAKVSSKLPAQSSELHHYFQSKNWKPVCVRIAVSRQVGIMLQYGLCRFLVFFFSVVIVLVFSPL